MKMIASSIAVVFAAIAVFAPGASNAEGWTDRIALKGDLRLRFEGIDIEGADDSRERYRYRGRVGLKAAVKDNLDLTFELATGGANPVSANTTFDGGFGKDDIRVNLAYLSWKASDSLTVHAGKMKNPVFRPGSSPLIYDGDLNPEGVALVFGSGIAFGNASVLIVEERSSDDDSFLLSFQGGAKLDIADESTLTVGAGYFEYTNTVGNSPFFFGAPLGNTVDAEGNYVFDYQNYELFAQYDAKVGEWPLRLYTHYTENMDPDEENAAFGIGAKLGSAKDKGTMQFSYAYQDVEADAVIASYNDSDFGGGGTDADGHILKYKYAMDKNIFIGGTLFINSIDRFQGVERDYDRIQIDVEFKFK